MEINQIYQGDCAKLAQNLQDNSVALVACSPPYAMQRKKSYGGINEKDYPSWTVNWMESFRPKLTNNGSIFIVIRPHIHQGQISDYVLRTQLELRNAGWIEAETLIWLKNDAPPLGSLNRPRRTWEYILWFTLSKKPFVNLYACGNEESTRTGGFAGSNRFEDTEMNPISKTQTRNLKNGTSRCTDVIKANVGSIDRGVLHPAMYPRTLSEFLIKTFSQEDDLVVDPFSGSGQTCISALQLNRKFIGFEIKEEYVELSKKRIFDLQK